MNEKIKSMTINPETLAKLYRILQEPSIWLKECIRVALREEGLSKSDLQNPDRLMTAQEVCELLSISKPTLYRLSELERIKLSGGVVRFRRGDVVDFLNTCKRKA